MRTHDLVFGGWVEDGVCVCVCVLLEFNPITVTALSRGTCDCAPDLGRDTPVLLLLFFASDLSDPPPFPVFPSRLSRPPPPSSRGFRSVM